MSAVEKLLSQSSGRSATIMRTLLAIAAAAAVAVLALASSCGAEARRSRTPKGVREELRKTRLVPQRQEAASGEVALNATAAARKQARLFPIFNIVTFHNSPCSSTISSSGTSTTNRNGTCLTNTKCQDDGGTVGGNCAAGFGVCCVFIINAASGGTVSQNCTYIQNNGFPSALTDTNGISFTIQKCSNDVCDVRLDFETFTTVATGVTTEATGGVCTDTLVIATPNSGQNVPTICGDNTGEHVYLNLGNQASDSATLTFAFSGSNTNRMFDIKVTQVDCTSQARPPDGCLQYHEGTTGRIETFNFNPTSGETHLQSQQYSVCIRQEAGFCCVEYAVCANTINPFTPDTSQTTSLIDSDCAEDYITIGEGSALCDATATNLQLVSRLCGIFFNPQDARTVNVPVCDCSPPFVVGISTDNTADVAAGANTAAILSRGVCLEYTQRPC